MKKHFNNKTKCIKMNFSSSLFSSFFIKVLFSVIVIFNLSLIKANAQSDFYDEQKKEYERLRKEEKYDSALVVAKKMCDWALSSNVNRRKYLHKSYYFVGLSFYEKLHFDSSLIYFNKVLYELKKCKLSDNELKDTIAADVFNYLGCVNFELYNLDIALSSYEKSLQLYQKSLGYNHQYCSDLLRNIAIVNEYLGEYELSIDLYRKSLNIDSINKKTFDNDIFEKEIAISRVYSLMNNYVLAKEYANRAYHSFYTNDKLIHSELSDLEESLGYINWLNGDNLEAECFYQEAVKDCNKILGDTSVDYNSKLFSLAAFYRSIDKPKKALDIINCSLFLLKDVDSCDLGMNDNSNNLFIYATILMDIQDYGKAEKALLRLTDYLYNDLNNNLDKSFKYKVYITVAEFYSKLDCFEKSEFYYKKALSLFNYNEQTYFDEYNWILNGMGFLYLNHGNYKLAEDCFKKVSNNFKNKNVQHSSYGDNLLGLAKLYVELFNFKDAVIICEKAIKFYEINEGYGSLGYIKAKIMLGYVYDRIGNPTLALKIYNEILELQLEKYSYDKKALFITYCCIGVSYYQLNNTEKAYFNYACALNLINDSNYISILDKANLFSNMGLVYNDLFNYKLALDYNLKSDSLFKSIHDTSSLDYLNNLSSLSNCFVLNNQFDAAFKSFCNVQRYCFSVFQEKSNWLSSKELFSFWMNSQFDFSDQYAFVQRYVDFDQSATTLSYSTLLNTKSLLSDLAIKKCLDLKLLENKYLSEVFFQMKQLRKQYSKLQSESFSDKHLTESCKVQADSLEKILVNNVGEYASSKSIFEKNWKDVQSNLNVNEASVEFARYYSNKDSCYRYIALIVRPNYQYPKLITLGDEIKIRNGIASKNFSELYDLVWRDIDTLLEGVKTIYYSPAGELNNVAFTALCYECNKSQLVTNSNQTSRGVIIQSDNITKQICTSVLMDKYELHQLTTTRYLADGTLINEKPLVPIINLVGGINYDEVSSHYQGEKTEVPIEDFALHANLNKMVSRTSSSYGKKMQYLSGTKEEVTKISKMLDNSVWQVYTFTDNSAGEYEFKKDVESRAPGILHIATHGFAFPNELKKEKMQFDSDQKNTYKLSDDPMVRCGLMLSGSNISWTGNPQKMIKQTGEDGILTAAEVANMDLSKTKLVVLSACETGLGKIEGSEGVFGLMRGFKLAGVEQMIVSLWSVPDKETMELMTLFYSDLVNTSNPVISFEKAQKEMRNKYPTEPNKWAGFVLVR